MTDRTYLVVGGTSGIGFELSRALLARGDRVVLTGRDAARAEAAADSLGDGATGRALDLSLPDEIVLRLADIGPLTGVVLAGVERDANTARDFNITRATRLATLKLVGYAETVHAILENVEASATTGIVLFGGVARYRPYPGSLTVSTVNGGVEGLSTALSVELAPIRVNVLHPGIIGDSPYWADKAQALANYRSRTPGGELATVEDVVGAALFLLDNRGVSGAELHVNRATLAS